MIAIGIGCRRNTSAAAIESLVRQALAQAASVAIPPVSGLPPLTVTTGGAPSTSYSWLGVQAALFTIEDKANEPGLIEAAQTFSLSLTFLPRAILRAQPVQTPSPRAQAEFGVPAVAEAAALAGAGPNAALILPRITANGVTCAIAATP